MAIIPRLAEFWPKSFSRLLESKTVRGLKLSRDDRLHEPWHDAGGYGTANARNAGLQRMADAEATAVE